MAGLYIEKYKFSNEPVLRVVNSDDDRNRAKEIALFVKEAALYKVNLKSLSGRNLKESVRNTSLNIAHDIIQNAEIYNEFTKRRELPYSKITKVLTVSRTFLEIWSQVITSYIIILANPNYRMLQDYLNVGLKDEVLDYVRIDKSEMCSGIVLKRYKKSAIILSGMGEFKKIHLGEGYRIGEEVKGKEKVGIRGYWKQIGAFSAAILILSSLAIYTYYRTASIVVINTTSSLKLEINPFRRVVYYYSPTEKGRSLLDSSDIKGANIDDAIVKVMTGAKENKMISDTVTIFINGEALEYNELTKSQSYFTENKMDVVINNAGYELKSRGEQKLNEESKDGQGQNEGTEATK